MLVQSGVGGSADDFEGEWDSGIGHVLHTIKVFIQPTRNGQFHHRTRHFIPLLGRVSDLKWWIKKNPINQSIAQSLEHSITAQVTNQSNDKSISQKNTTNQYWKPRWATHKKRNNLTATFSPEIPWHAWKIVQTPLWAAAPSSHPTPSNCSAWPSTAPPIYSPWPRSMDVPLAFRRTRRNVVREWGSMRGHRVALGRRTDTRDAGDSPLRWWGLAGDSPHDPSRELMVRRLLEGHFLRQWTIPTRRHWQIRRGKRKRPNLQRDHNTKYTRFYTQSSIQEVIPTLIDQHEELMEKQCQLSNGPIKRKITWNS